MIDSHVVLPAQSCVDADHYDMSAFAKTVVDYYTVNGVLWPASANPSSALVYYNKDHFRRAGLDPEQPPRTLAEIRTDAEKIKAAGIVDKPFVHELASYKTEFWLTGATAPIVDNDNGRQGAATAAALVGNDATLRLFQWFKQMNDDGLMQPIPVAEGQINQYLAMANQTASMWWRPRLGHLDPGLPGRQPHGDERRRGRTRPRHPRLRRRRLSGHRRARTHPDGRARLVHHVDHRPGVQAGAWDFMKFMNGEHAQTKMLVDGSYLPYRTAVSDTPEAQAFYSGSLAGGWLKIANQQVRPSTPSSRGRSSVPTTRPGWPWSTP